LFENIKSLTLKEHQHFKRFSLEISGTLLIIYFPDWIASRSDKSHGIWSA